MFSFLRIPANKLLYAGASMIFFWAIFDGLISYLVPLYITGAGFTKTEMGLIIASANIFGAFFDFFLSNFLTDTNYRRLFLVLYGVCSIFPLLLWSSSTIFLFIFSMAVWGLFQDIQKFATFDFICSQDNKKMHTHKFSVLNIFKTMGYLFAPLIAGFSITYVVTFLPFLIALIFLLISFICYLILLKISFKHHVLPVREKYNLSFFKEIDLWRKIGAVLLPVLIFNTMLYTFDAIFWVLGPLFASSFKNFHDFGGLFMTAYILPTILVGWFVGEITQRYGKKRTAYISFLFFSSIITYIGFLDSPVLIIMAVFIASFIGGIARPAIRGAYLDYMTETHKYQKEITGLNDFSQNIGAIGGPIIAGVLADQFGIRNTFAIVGFFSVMLTFILYSFTPKDIRVPQEF